MVIYLQDPSGMAQGIQTAGSALARGLEQRAAGRLMQQQRSALGNILSEEDPSTLQGYRNIVQKATNANIDPTVLGQILKPYQTILSEKVKQEGADNHLSKILNKQAPVQDVLNPPDPLQVENPGITDTSSVANDNPIIQDTVEGPNGELITDEQINQMLASPYPTHQRYGKALREELNKKQERAYKESAEIRKEHRAEIRKMTEPYSDFAKLRDNVQRMKEVEEVIEQEGANFDDDAYKNAFIALVEDREGALLADTFKTPEQQKLYSLLRPFFNTREVGGSNPSTREMQATLATLPGFTKSQETNRHIAKLMTNNVKLLLEQAKIMRSLRDKNLTAAQFQEQVDEKLQPLREQNQKDLNVIKEMAYQAQKLKGSRPEEGYVYMFVPSDSSVRKIAEKDVDEALKLGAMRFNAR